jgi:hypothetical protein
MSDLDQTRKMAEQGTEAFNVSLKKGTAAVERSVQDVEKNLSTSVDAMRHYNLKMIELARTNSEALFDFAQKMTMARSPTDIAELWKHTAKSKLRCSIGRRLKCHLLRSPCL